MPETTIREKFELHTRNKYTKVDCAITITLTGNELPNTAIIGDSLDEAIVLIQERVVESYKAVPPRDGTTPNGLVGNKPNNETIITERKPTPLPDPALVPTTQQAPSNPSNPSPPTF